MGYSSKVHRCKVCRLLGLHPELKEIVDKKLQCTASIEQVMNELNELGYKIAHEVLRQHYHRCLSLEDKAVYSIKGKLIPFQQKRTAIKPNAEIMLSIDDIMIGLQRVYIEFMQKYDSFMAKDENVDVTPQNVYLYRGFIQDAQNLSLNIAKMINDRKFVAAVVEYFMLAAANIMGKQLSAIEQTAVKEQIIAAIVNSVKLAGEATKEHYKLDIPM